MKLKYDNIKVKCAECGHERGQHFHDVRNHKFTYCTLYRKCNCQCLEFKFSHSEMDLSQTDILILNDITDTENNLDFRYNCLCKIKKRILNMDERTLINSLDKLTKLNYLDRIENGEIINDIGDDPIFIIN
jgi:hypothetical protein